jgi:ABC-type antimicrobial peptide transport system permease subunit
MIIFTLRRLLLLLVTLFFLTFVGFSLSYFTPHAPLHGSSLWDAWLFWFNGLLHWDFGVSSINGQLDFRTAERGFPGHDGAVHSGFRLCSDGGHSGGDAGGDLSQQMAG